MELLRFAWEGLQLLSPDASQMPPQPQAPKCFPNGFQMPSNWHQNVSQVGSKNAVWGLVLGLFIVLRLVLDHRLALIGCLFLLMMYVRVVVVVFG